MTRTSLVIGASLLAIAPMGLLTHQWIGPVDGRGASRDRDRVIAELRAELEALRGRVETTRSGAEEPSGGDVAWLAAAVDRLDRQQSELARELAKADGLERQTVDPGAADASPPSLLEEGPDAGAERADRHFETIEEKLRAEPEDPAWARDAESRLYDSLAHEDLSELSVERAACRSTLCEVEIESSAGEGAAAALQRMSNFLPWDGVSMIRGQIREDGSVRATVLVARDGHGLPEVAAD